MIYNIIIGIQYKGCKSNTNYWNEENDVSSEKYSWKYESWSSNMAAKSE